MTERQRCGCSDSCGFPADETGYYLLHDPRPTPEREDQRRAILTERAALGRAKCAENRAATAEALSDALRVSLRTIDGQLAALDSLLQLLVDSKLDAAKIAASGAQLIKTAHDILRSDTERTAARLAKLLEEHPQLSRRLQAVVE
jgi:hypothetical protein